MKPVSCGIAMSGWLSSISRSSVVPVPIAPTMKIGPRTGAGSRGEMSGIHLVALVGLRRRDDRLRATALDADPPGESLGGPAHRARQPVDGRSHGHARA